MTLSSLKSAAFLLALLAAASLTAFSADPDAQSILRDARSAQASQQRTLPGHLRVQSTGVKIPFTLVLNGNEIRYEFKDSAILLRLGENNSQLLEAAHGDLTKVSAARYDSPVKGTDLTYEDLSLKFLYWPKAKIDGSETVDALNCWKLHLEPAGQPSAYSVMLLWVSKRTGAFLRGEGYDASGKLVKAFKVIGGQHDPSGGPGYILKKMRIETLAPGKPASITYLEID